MDTSFANAYMNKSEIYERARPQYPEEAITFICQQLDLSQRLPVVDVGSGTGILTRQLADSGLTMIGIEPNSQMITQAQAFASPLNINYFSGSAEQLGLASASVAALICGQSFHWFEPQKALTEFRRVLAINNPVVLIWNIRSPDYNEFHLAYEQLLGELFEKYAQTLLIDDELEKRIECFFSRVFEERAFHNSQQLDVSDFLARTLSCSYAAQSKTPEYLRANRVLQEFHQNYQHQGKITLNYTTRVVYGHI